MQARAQKHVMRLLSHDDGAIVVFGVFFAAFVAGMLYYVVGLGNAIYYHDRLQDAADAAAFGSAVVHARGMNTLALINMVMAALLSVLVTLKLIYALVTVAEVIMASLSWFFGATAGVAAALEIVRQEVDAAQEAAEPIIGQALEVLHQAGEVVRVVVPVGANASVLPTTPEYFSEVEFAVAIPARLTLPVESDEYPYLCNKAGVMAATLALAPLSPVLPNMIESRVTKAVGDLTEKMSNWFCGDKSAGPPTFELDELEAPYPMSAENRKCVEYKPKANEPKDARQQACLEAERNDMMATPNARTGRCRRGDVVCDMRSLDIRDEDSPTGYYQPREGSYCAGKGQSEVIQAADCAMDRSSPYGRRLLDARATCKPTEGKTLHGYWWIEKEVRVVWKWNPNPDSPSRGTWTKRIASEGPEVSRRNEDPDSRSYDDVPCDFRPGSPGWPTDNLSSDVCSTEGEPYTRPPDINLLRRLDENNELPARTHIVVTQVLGCSATQPPKTVQVDNVDLSADSDIVQSEEGGNGQESDDSKSPFRFEVGHKLGTSDMQTRALVWGKAPGSMRAARDADRIVGATRWGDERSSGATFLSTARDWGRLTVAQAEYFFDGRSVSDDDRFCDPSDQRDWLWYMGWTARLRRFRLDFGDADGDSERKQDDREGLRKYVPQNLTSKLEVNGRVDGKKPACKGGSCNDASSALSTFQDLFLH